MTLFEAFETHRRDQIVFANRSHKTEEAYIYTRKSLLKFIGKDILLEDLDFATLRSWKISLEKRGLVSGTIRGYIVNTRVVLSYMQKLGHNCIDPETVPIPKREDRAPSVLTPEEVTHVIDVIGSIPCASRLNKARNKAIVALLYSSAIRVNEMTALNREDVKGDTFTVYGKGRKQRPCMIDSRARLLLNQYLSLRDDNHEALFVDNLNSGRMKANTVQAQFRRINKYTALSKSVHPHTLRHSFATDLMRKGCHIYPLSRMMGHSSIATTQVYFQIHDPELEELHRKYHTIT